MLWSRDFHTCCDYDHQLLWPFCVTVSLWVTRSSLVVFHHSWWIWCGGEGMFLPWRCWCHFHCRHFILKKTNCCLSLVVFHHSWWIWCVGEGMFLPWRCRCHFHCRHFMLKKTNCCLSVCKWKINADLCVDVCEDISLKLSIISFSQGHGCTKKLNFCTPPPTPTPPHPTPPSQNCIVGYVTAVMGHLLFFPGSPFPKNYHSVVKKILKRLFRVFVHVYIHHFDKLIAMGAVSVMHLVLLMSSSEHASQHRVSLSTDCCSLMVIMYTPWKMCRSEKQTKIGALDWTSDSTQTQTWSRTQCSCWLWPTTCLQLAKQCKQRPEKTSANKDWSAVFESLPYCSWCVERSGKSQTDLQVNTTVRA